MGFMRLIKPFKRMTPHRDKVSAGEWNRLVTMVENFASSQVTQGIIDNSGIHNRRLKSAAIPLFNWYELTSVAANPLVGKLQTCTSGVFTDVNTDEVNIYVYPQLDKKQYLVGDHIFAHFIGNCWVSLYNTPVAFDVCT